MTTSHLDDLRVVDISRVRADRNRLGWTCTRCRDEHAPTRSWWATYAYPHGDTFTVVLCDPCWRETRARLEHEAFGYAGPVR